jgi:hypothetical protein
MLNRRLRTMVANPLPRVGFEHLLQLLTTAYGPQRRFAAMQQHVCNEGKPDGRWMRPEPPLVTDSVEKGGRDRQGAKKAAKAAKPPPPFPSRFGFEPDEQILSLHNPASFFTNLRKFFVLV